MLTFGSPTLTDNKIKWPLNLTEKCESEYRFNATIPSENLTISIKMQYIDYHKNYYDIYFLSSKYVSIKLFLYFLENNSCSNFTERDLIKRKHEFPIFECNKWQYLNTSNISILNMDSLIFSYDIQEIEKETCSDKLGNNYSILLSAGQFSDIVTIKSVEGQEHKVHKEMLINKSEVLKAHFEHDTTESRTNVVESSLENKVLLDILIFIYWNTAPNIKDMPEKLFAAADYYQLNELKALCEETLKEKLCVDNALNILEIADLHSSESLKQFALEYIKHEIKLIIKTEAWVKMESNFVLKNKIIEYIVMNGYVKIFVI